MESEQSAKIKKKLEPTGRPVRKAAIQSRQKTQKIKKEFFEKEEDEEENEDMDEESEEEVVVKKKHVDTKRGKHEAKPVQKKSKTDVKKSKVVEKERSSRSNLKRTSTTQHDT